MDKICNTVTEHIGQNSGFIRENMTDNNPATGGLLQPSPGAVDLQVEGRQANILSFSLREELDDFILFELQLVLEINHCEK